MSFEMQAILESKRVLHRQLAARPFAEKLQLLEKLQERMLAIRTAKEPATPRG